MNFQTTQGRVFMTHQIFRFAALILAANVALCHWNQSIADDVVSPPTSPAAEAASPVVDKEATRYELRYKCAIGDVWRYEQTLKASIRSTIEESTEAAQFKTDSVRSWKITDVLADGTIEFMIVVEKIHMVNQLPDKEPTDYDSQRDTTPPPGYEEAASRVGVPLSLVRMTPHGKITRREAKLKRGSSDDDGPLTVLLPDHPIAVGETWDEPLDLTVKLKTGGTKAIQTRRHYKLAKVENKLATITIEFQVLTPIDAHIESQLVHLLMNGEARFDIEAGRVVSRKMDIDKSILGFAGQASSMQYVMRMEEKLLFAPHKITAKPAEKPVAKVADAPPKPATPPTTNPTPPPSPTRTATRPTNKQPSQNTKRR
jgi:hypothetical protein